MEKFTFAPSFVDRKEFSMPDVSSDILIILLALAVLFLGAWCSRAVSRWWRRFLMQRRFKRGHKGEEKARAYLKRNGYKILGEEVTIEPFMWIDGEKTKYKVRADYLAEKKGVRSIFEVKNGKAANFTDRATRRQLREYAAVYDVDQVCLYDGNTDSHVTVAFDCTPIPMSSRGLPKWVVGFVLGLIAGIAVSIWMAPVISASVENVKKIVSFVEDADFGSSL